MAADTIRLNQAVFLDRDGVINRKLPEDNYVKSPQELELLHQVGPAIADLNAAGFMVIVITNQRGVARGFMSLEDLDDVHTRLRELLEPWGARIDEIYACTHDKSDGCECRKPRPGLILTAAAEKRIALKQSWMIGDRESDIEAGRSAGCRTVLVQNNLVETKADEQVSSLKAAVDLILEECNQDQT